MVAIEQLTYLIFIRRLDQAQERKERYARRFGKPVLDPIYRPDQEHLRWSNLRNLGAGLLFEVMRDEVFPFLRRVGGDETTYAQHMAGARLEISPALLARIVDSVSDLPLDNVDLSGDLYEYMLSKLSSSGQNGQFRTPRQIIDLMVAITDPKPGDKIIDPACGTAGFLVSAAEYVKQKYPSVLTDATDRRHFHHGMFAGYDFDSTMLRIGSMNMLMHGVESPDISYRDSLSEAGDADDNGFSLVLANPPFAGSLDYESTSAALQRMVRTKKTELLFLARFLKLLRPGGRAAVIVPEGVLFGSSKAHRAIREELVDRQKLDAVIKLPSGVFRPYAGVSTAILLFTKTDTAGDTDRVWFYEVTADGWSLDDKRSALLPDEKLGVTPAVALDAGEHERNNLPDLLSRWQSRTSADEQNRERTEQSFFVGRDEIVEQGYDLSMNRYKEIVVDTTEHRAPAEIIAELEQLEVEIAAGLGRLKEMLT